LLVLLVDRRGELVTRDQIAERLWGKDVFLDTDNSINAAVRKLRQVLKDDPERPRFILTVTGKGYRFVAPVEEVSTSLQETSAPDQTSPGKIVTAEDALGGMASRRELGGLAAGKQPASWGRAKLAAGLAGASALLVAFLLASNVGDIRSRLLREPVTSGTERPQRQTPQGDNVRGAQSKPRTLAVLPFRGLSENGGEESWGIGMTDAIIA